jgi:RecJ-like exonuclease
MADTLTCPVCQGSGMVGASSCGRCRGTGAVRMADPGLAESVAARPAEVDPEIREIVEEELGEELGSARLKLKGGRQVKLTAGPRRGGGKGLSFRR